MNIFTTVITAEYQCKIHHWKSQLLHWWIMWEFNVPVELLDKRLRDEHIRAVSRFLQWRRVAPYLMLEDSEIEAVNWMGIMRRRGNTSPFIHGRENLPSKRG